MDPLQSILAKSAYLEDHSHQRAQSRAQTPAPNGATPKPHISGALKFVIGEEHRAQALAAAEVWKQRFAEEAKWKNVVAKINSFAKEDPLREHHVARRQTRSSDQPWLNAPSDTDHKERTTNVISQDDIEADERTPRVLGDLVSLKQKSRPKNIQNNPHTPTFVPPPFRSPFSPGGFWESLAPTTPTPTAHGLAIPLTAIPHPPIYSTTLPTSPSALSAYETVKREIADTALRMCASRLSIHNLFTNQIGLKANMVRIKDELHAAEAVLAYRRLNLKEYIDAELPAKLDALADEGANLVRRNCIPSVEVLKEGVESWLQIQDGSLEFRTILDVQREGLVRHAKSIMGKELLGVCGKVLEIVWATRILEDKELEVGGRGDEESRGSDEDVGYEYGNFMLDLRKGVDGWVVGDAVTVGEERCMRSLTVSDRDETRGQISNTLPFRTNDYNTNPSHNPNDTPPNLPRKPNARPFPPKLKICTSNLSTSSQVSPLERGLRRQGPSFTDLATWANELRGMEMQSRSRSRPRLGVRGRGHGREGKPEGVTRSPSMSSGETGRVRYMSEESTSQTSLASTVGIRTAITTTTDAHRHCRNKSSTSPMPSSRFSASSSSSASDYNEHDGDSIDDSKDEVETGYSINNHGSQHDNDNDDWATLLRKMEDREDHRRLEERELFGAAVRGRSRGG